MIQQKYRFPKDAKWQPTHLVVANEESNKYSLGFKKPDVGKLMPAHIFTDEERRQQRLLQEVQGVVYINGDYWFVYYSDITIVGNLFR